MKKIGIHFLVNRLQLNHFTTAKKVESASISSYKMIYDWFSVKIDESRVKFLIEIFWFSWELVYLKWWWFIYTYGIWNIIFLISFLWLNKLITQKFLISLVSPAKIPQLWINIHRSQPTSSYNAFYENLLNPNKTSCQVNRNAHLNEHGIIKNPSQIKKTL